MTDSTPQRNIRDGSLDDEGDNETMQQVHQEADPDLSWILEATNTDAFSTCDHSDHEHVMQSSSSESLDDIELLGDQQSNSIAANLNVNATKPQRSPSISRLSEEPASPADATSKAIGRGTVNMAALQAPASPTRTPRQQNTQRLKKINGDDTILNLYAATVAKALSSPANKQDAKTGIAPIITSPKNTKPRVVFHRASLTIRPEVSKPTKNTVTPPKSALPVPTTTITPSSPLTKVRSMATGNAKMPNRVSLEVSDHDDENLDAVMLKSLDSPVSDPKNIPSAVNTNVNPSATATASKSSLLNSSPKSEQRHQQFLQLEIAKELDGGNSSRRFQLAIQSHVSSLTLGTFADQDMNGDDLSVSGATFCQNYSMSPGYHNQDDDEETMVPQEEEEASATPTRDSDDEAVEVMLDDDEQTFASQPIGAEEGLIPIDERAKMSPHPALLSQKSHSWVRRRLWGQQQLQPQQQQQGASDPLGVSDGAPDGPDISTTAAPDTTHPTLSTTTPVPTSDPPVTKKMDGLSWYNWMAFYCLFYVIPFTHQAGTSLPHIYFLIELVDVYDTKLYLAGIYLSISVILRYAMQSFIERTPRIAAIVGTVATLAGYLILFLTEKINKNQFTSESNVLNETLFILGNVMIGSIDLVSCVIAIVQEETCITSSCSDCGIKTLLVRGWNTQFNVIQVSTIVSYAIGGVIYEYWDIAGISITGFTLIGLQLICLLIALKSESLCPTKQIFSQECQKLNFFQPDYAEVDVISSPKSDFKLRRDDGNKSFRSMVTPELETIEESPVAESDSDDDPSTKISYFDPERNDQLLWNRQSVVSTSSGTPEVDNRTSIVEMNAELVRRKYEQYPLNSYETMMNNHVPPLQWKEIYVTVGAAVQPALQGLVLGVGTLLLFQEFGRDKTIVGYVYAASSVCGALATAIPLSLLDHRHLERWNMSGSLYLFGTTYMIFLTAISIFSVYVVGVLMMSFFLGLFVRSMNEAQFQLIQSNNKNYPQIIPYRKWIRFISLLVVTLLSPILYDVLPRLTNMVGSGICLVVTIFVWYGSDAAKNNEHEDSDRNKVNTTADTIPSEAINNDSSKLDEKEQTKEEFATSLVVHRVRLETLR